jgi:predicted amidohydrolase
VWRSYRISRAAETQRFVIAANVADRHQHCPTMIITPTGEVLAEAERGEIELICTAEVSVLVFAASRAALFRVRNSPSPAVLRREPTRRMNLAIVCQRRRP